MKDLLKNIAGPQDLKKLKNDELYELADCIRVRLAEVISRQGGHMASNLGIVELTIALHRVFDSPVDKILFDVSHQCYVHKLLTGRDNEKFSLLHQEDGYSGFLNPNESEHDAFVIGHAGTALSTALGLCIARDRLKQNYNVIAVVGDGALTCGQTMEALNNVPISTNRLVLVVNDNGFSISPNVGAIALYFSKIKLCGRTIRHLMCACAKKKNKFCRFLERSYCRLKLALGGLFSSSSLFEHCGLRYIGPIDGHDIEQLEDHLRFCKKLNYPVLLHVKTVKGKGNFAAVDDPESFHRTFPAGSKPETSMGDAFGQAVANLARTNDRIIGVTAAMSGGTGLSYLQSIFPERYIDVGIAEEHAVTLCAGLAKAGMQPICAIFSTFVQRAFDQIFHDVCLQNLPVVFCLDRAGLSPNEGPTHHGLLDISFMRCLPNAVILQPKDSNELISMLTFAMAHSGPVFIRYNSGYDLCLNTEKSYNIELGKSEVVKDGQDVCLIGLGYCVKISKQVDNILGGTCGIVNARFIKPLDGEMLADVARRYKTIVTLEDNVLAGGFGSAVLEYYSDNHMNVNVVRMGWPDSFVDHGSDQDVLRENYKLDAKSMADNISKINS